CHLTGVVAAHTVGDDKDPASQGIALDHLCEAGVLVLLTLLANVGFCGGFEAQRHAALPLISEDSKTGSRRGCRANFRASGWPSCLYCYITSHKRSPVSRRRSPVGDRTVFYGVGWAVLAVHNWSTDTIRCEDLKTTCIPMTRLDGVVA